MIELLLLVLLAAFAGFVVSQFAGRDWGLIAFGILAVLVVLFWVEGNPTVFR